MSPPTAVTVDKNAELSGGNLLTRWQRTLTGGSDIQLQVYYDRVNRLQTNQAEYRNTFDVDFVHHLMLNKRQDFIWGLEARLSPGQASRDHTYICIYAGPAGRPGLHCLCAG